MGNYDYFYHAHTDTHAHTYTYKHTYTNTHKGRTQRKLCLYFSIVKSLTFIIKRICWYKENDFLLSNRKGFVNTTWTDMPRDKLSVKWSSNKLRQNKNIHIYAYVPFFSSSFLPFYFLSILPFLVFFFPNICEHPLSCKFLLRFGESTPKRTRPPFTRRPEKGMLRGASPT